MQIVVIDGQGGNIGRAIIEELRARKPEAQIIAIGTNATATANMLKGGAHQGATGENPVRVCAPKADYIMGPVGIILADSMLGEITPSIAEAVGASDAHKIIIPINKCITIAGVDTSLSVKEYIKMAVDKVGD